MFFTLILEKQTGELYHGILDRRIDVAINDQRNLQEK